MCMVRPPEVFHELVIVKDSKLDGNLGFNEIQDDAFVSTGSL